MEEKKVNSSEKNVDAYLKAILDKFNKERNGSLNTYLSKPTNASIRDKIMSMLRKGENIDFENALKGFLGKHRITNREDLIDIAYKNIDSYRAIQRLLLGITTNGKNNAYLLRITAFLVELEENDDNTNKLDGNNSQDKNGDSDSENNDLKQTNILSASNFSKITKTKGKIKQLNLLGFRNKQVIDSENKGGEE